MNSLAIIETGTDGYQLHYIAGLISNVLRVNSAVEHQTFGMRIHRMMEKAHPPVKTGAGSLFGQPPPAEKAM